MPIAELLALRAACDPSGPLGDFFDRGRELALARAPGRLDVMGGIADYSGSLVLELPLAEAALVAAQRHEEPCVRVASVAPDGTGSLRSLDVPLAELERGHAHARAWFAAEPKRRFAAYLAGTAAELCATSRVAFSGAGLRLLVLSSVPEGSGVGSSAAITVAAMVALSALLGQRTSGRDLALACQRVENLVVGAPSGVMDPMAATLGEEGRLLALLCQPAEIRGQLPLPEDIELFGIDSRIRHHVAGAEYGTVRAAAFMGRRVLAERLGAPVAHLANVCPAELERHVKALPVELTGSEFLARYAVTQDPVTNLEDERSYPVRAATRHAIEEHERASLFAAAIRDAAVPLELERLGELMYASHASYSACGLGSPGTDRVVELVRGAGPARGLYGAKITGGGSGGTVAVLARRGARTEVERVARAYAREAGSEPRVFAGSSAGASTFGAVEVSLETEALRRVQVFV